MAGALTTSSTSTKYAIILCGLTVTVAAYLFLPRDNNKGEKDIPKRGAMASNGCEKILSDSGGSSSNSSTTCVADENPLNVANSKPITQAPDVEDEDNLVSVAAMTAAADNALASAAAIAAKKASKNKRKKSNRKKKSLQKVAAAKEIKDFHKSQRGKK